MKGGFTPEESCCSKLKIIESAGVDNIEVSGGTYEQPKLLGLGQKSAFNPKEVR